MKCIVRILPAAAAALLLAGPVRAQPARKAPARPSRPRVELKVGQPAPDVALNPLTFFRNEKGEMLARIGAEKVRLSDFKGKAPICIFSSSYT